MRVELSVCAADSVILATGTGDVTWSGGRAILTYSPSMAVVVGGTSTHVLAYLPDIDLTIPMSIPASEQRQMEPEQHVTVEPLNGVLISSVVNVI